jgi:hypothetical protein
MGALGLMSKKGRKSAAKVVSKVPSVQVAKKVTKAKAKAVKSVAKEKPQVFAKAVEKAGMTKKKTLGSQ